MLNYQEIRYQVGRNLQRIRRDKGWSVHALAVLSGIDERQIAEIEDGTEDFDIAIIIALAEELNVDFRRILIDNIHR